MLNFYFDLSDHNRNNEPEESRVPQVTMITNDNNVSSHLRGVRLRNAFQAFQAAGKPGTAIFVSHGSSSRA